MFSCLWNESRRNRNAHSPHKGNDVQLQIGGRGWELWLTKRMPNSRNRRRGRKAVSCFDPAYRCEQLRDETNPGALSLLLDQGRENAQLPVPERRRQKQLMSERRASLGVHNVVTSLSCRFLS